MSLDSNIPDRRSMGRSYPPSDNDTDDDLWDDDGSNDRFLVQNTNATYEKPRVHQRSTSSAYHKVGEENENSDDGD